MPTILNARPANEAAEPASLPNRELQRGAVIADLTVRDLVALYISLELPELAPGSQKHRKRYLTAFADQFGHLAWDGVRTSDIKAWVRATERWKSDNSRKTVVVAVNRLFRWAFDDDRIPRLPVKKLTWAEGKPRRSMTGPEYRALLRSCDPPFRRVLLFIRETGCRPQDVAHLTLPMVHWEAGLALLPEHKTVKVTHKPKRLYLSALALRLLRWLERCPAVAPTRGWPGLFAAEVGPEQHPFLNSFHEPWTSNALSMRLYRLRLKLRLDKQCVLYGLRHSLGNRLRAEGVDIRTVADIYGHSSVRTSERYYLHADETTQAARAALERVSTKTAQNRR